jgi:hypothetical protein
MTTLPTLTVTQDQADRMLAAFAPHANATAAETVAAYKEWLRVQIVNRVIDFEVSQVQASVTEAEVAKKAEVVGALPGPPPPPAAPDVPVLPTP